MDPTTVAVLATLLITWGCAAIALAIATGRRLGHQARACEPPPDPAELATLAELVADDDALLEDLRAGAVGDGTELSEMLARWRAEVFADPPEGC